MEEMEFEITSDDISEYIYNSLISRGLAPYKQDVEEITDIFFDLLIHLGIMTPE